MGSSSERHNELAPAALRLIVGGTVGVGEPASAMLTVLESVAMGVIEMAARMSGGDERHARSIYLDAFVDGLAERLAFLNATTPPGGTHE